MSHVRRAVACIVTLTAALCIPALTAGAADPTTVSNAVAYLSASPPQNPGTTPATGSGAWDDDPNFQFATTEVVLAIAESAQTGGSWDTSAAAAAVAATQNPQGESPLPFLDLVTAAATTPGQAAKYLVLVGAPLGQDTTTLAATIGDPAPDGSFATDLHFTDTLFAALAKRRPDRFGAGVDRRVHREQAAGRGLVGLRRNHDHRPRHRHDRPRGAGAHRRWGRAERSRDHAGAHLARIAAERRRHLVVLRRPERREHLPRGARRDRGRIRRELALLARLRVLERQWASRSSAPTPRSRRWLTPTAASRGRTCSARCTRPDRPCRASSVPGFRWRARPMSRARRSRR